MGIFFTEVTFDNVYYFHSTVQVRGTHTCKFFKHKNARERGSLVCMKQSFVSPFVTLNVC